MSGKSNKVAAGLAIMLLWMGASQVQAQQFTWTGFYLGVNAGYGWSDDDRSTLTVDPVLAAGVPVGGGTLTFDPTEIDGPLGGAQIGVNWQFTPGFGFVVGLEADIQGIDLRRERIRPVPGTLTLFDEPDLPVDVIREGGLNWFGTARARAGFGFDRFLVYGTAGFAFGGGDESTRDERNDSTRGGYAVGGGIEFDMAYLTGGPFGSIIVPVTTLAFEGLFVNLDEDRNPRTAVVDGPTVRVRHEEEGFGVVRAKINIKY